MIRALLERTGVGEAYARSRPSLLKPPGHDNCISTLTTTVNVTTLFVKYNVGICVPFIVAQTVARDSLLYCHGFFQSNMVLNNVPNYPTSIRW